MVLPTGRREAAKNELRIFFGGQLLIHALVRIDESQNPIHVDYYNIGGFAKGTMQQGIMKWARRGSVFLHGRPGAAAPGDFEMHCRERPHSQPMAAGALTLANSTLARRRSR